MKIRLPAAHLFLREMFFYVLIVIGYYRLPDSSLINPDIKIDTAPDHLCRSLRQRFFQLRQLSLDEITVDVII